jgi:predicted Rossmann fold flavoprotein
VAPTSKKPNHWDVAIIGGGAAGLFAAGIAGQRGRRVIVLEHNRQVGAKIAISGGGRCNFTNLDIRPDRFISDNPHFARSALSRFTQHDFINLVKRHQIPFYEKTLGQLFCEGAAAAKLIIQMLLDECPDTVDIRTSVSVIGVEKSGDFSVHTSEGTLTAASVIVASGGLSIPKLGASRLAYDIARRFDVPLTPLAPALVPLTFSEVERGWMVELAGVSVEAKASGHGPWGRGSFREGLMFTHRGLTGPSILQVSSYLDGPTPIEIDLLPDTPGAQALLHAKQERPKQQLGTALASVLPTRLVDALLPRLAPNLPWSARLADMKNADLEALSAALHHWHIHPNGDEGYAKAEVTRGGVSTKALDQKTMAARSVPGLHFIGEAVDVTGWLGGYNFQWAWSSGFAAGMAA